MRRVFLATCGVVALSMPAVAAENTERAAQPFGGIENIVVTARQRAESLQDVPVAVSALDAQFLDKNFIPNIDSVENYMPNVELGRHPFTGGGMSASIRGISFGDLDRAFEPAVAVSVDGIFLASNTGAMVDAFDVESIEVLRGPQGTLFGRNTIGGVINIKRSKPTMDWGAKGQVTIGSYGQNDYKAIVNAPVVKDVIGVKIGGYIEKGKSHTRNYFDGERDPGIDKMAVFGAIRITPGDNFEVNLTIDHIDDKSEYPKLVPISADNQVFCAAFGACGSTWGKIAEESGYKLSFDKHPFSAKLKSTAFVSNMKLDLDQISLESITGYITQKDALNVENTGSPALPGGTSLFVSTRDQRANQFSQEFRAVSSWEGPFNFVAGVYYMRSEFNLWRQQVMVSGGLAQNFEAAQELDAYAAYAEGYYSITDDIRLTVGARYTSEKKNFSITHYGPGAAQSIIFTCPDTTAALGTGVDSCIDPSVTFKKLTPRISLDYHLTDDVMVYGGWSRGYRSGGWNSRATVATAIGPYDPETVDSYEAGLRTTFLDNRVRLNITAFEAKYKNKQEEVITASPINPLVTQTLVQNAASATIKGFEGELEMAPTDWLHLRSAVGYLDAGYDNFFSNGVDVSAERNLRYAPKWSVSVGGDATIPVTMTDGEIIIAANYKWTDRFATAVVKDTLGLNRDFIDAYGRFDASISYGAELSDGRSAYKIAAYVHNAFHDDGRLYRKVIVGPFSFASQEVGRTWGLELSFIY